MRFRATIISPTRFVLKRISAEVGLVDFTNLLKDDCAALEYGAEPRGITLTFCMRSEHSAARMRPLLAKSFAKLKALYAKEADTLLFNARATV